MSVVVGWRQQQEVSAGDKWYDNVSALKKNARATIENDMHLVNIWFTLILIEIWEFICVFLSQINETRCLEENVILEV